MNNHAGASVANRAKPRETSRPRHPDNAINAAADSQASPIDCPRDGTVAFDLETAKQTWRADGRRRIQTHWSTAIVRAASPVFVGLLCSMLGCRTPVVFEGLSDAQSPLETFRSPVADDDIAALVRHHATLAVAAASEGRLDQARAHREAHRSLQALVEDDDTIDPGVDRREWASLVELLEADEVEPEVNEGGGRASPEGLRASASTRPSLSALSASVPSRPAGTATATTAGFSSANAMTAVRSRSAVARTSVDATTASTATVDEAGPPSAVAVARPKAKAKAPKVEDPKAWLEAQVRRILVEFGEARSVKLPATFLNQVRAVVDAYTSGAQRIWFAKSLHRMDKYLPTIHGIFSERRLPESFYYLALVESAFNPNARSRVGAVGLWQFMPDTARRYGLTVRRGLDERRDPIKATRAAREYLLDLVLEFGAGHSMLLAMAAYNAGEGRVRHRLRQLRDYRNRNFWTLAERKLLPAETRRYVPTIIAAAVIGRNRSRFGLAAARPTGAVARVELRHPVSIPYLLRASKMAEASLLALNPDLDATSGVTPADTRYQLVLPTDVAARLEHDPVLLAARRPTPGRRVAKAARPKRKRRGRYLTYRVQANDTWRSISTWSGVSRSRLRKDNPRAARVGLRPGRVVYLHGVPRNLRQLHHVVEPRQSLAEIGRLYGVPQRWVAQWNGLTTRRLQIGQRLVIYTRSGRAKERASSSGRSAPVPLTYRVMPNDTWWKIGQWSGIDQDRLRRDNPVAAKVGLRPGQTIVLGGARDLRRYEHVVRSRETLSQIAKRYRTRAEWIKHWNALASDRLSVGHRLVIYGQTGVR